MIPEVTATGSHQRKLLIGITGGIGAGKSVVSRILRLKGYPVYDCDSRARALMEESEYILNSLCGRFGNECLLEGGSLNRGYIASRVFADEEERLWLNALVHREVHADLKSWLEAAESDTCFVESAILVTSHLDAMCDRIWLVDAPEELRLGRGLERGGIERENLMKRMEAQSREFETLPEDKTDVIMNDGIHSLLARIDVLLKGTTETSDN